MIKRNLLGAVVAVIFLAGSSFAQDSTDQRNPPQGQGDGAQHSHRAPSQAAIDACSGKSQGDACDYTNSKGEDRAGTCANTNDNQLFCKRSRRVPS